MNKSLIEKAARMIKDSAKVMVLTGAGISTESGIPDFRSPNTGLWENIDPMEALSTAVLYNDPNKFYKEGFQMLLSMTNAEPNKGHLVLAEMERLGYIKGIITQNIDNLHHKAGSKYILEVHGNTREGSCLDCGEIVGLNVLEGKINKGEIPPKCEKCGGLLRPNVVFFGDMLPEDFNIAWEEIDDCDLLIVIGSSLSVSPVNYLPQKAKKLIIINVGPTMMDNHGDIVIREKSGMVLEEIFKELTKN
ncbi:NAD-dependent protein deacylase [Tissierella sp. MSJ-40]|uniref:protein acetyllysine N-acetyltransferase n=1 Tax=Tissierella simiarum TaxID=2841534 RepID=A0ABS6E826_9FIRM|nr:NAD-dependent protein deacylase [Tissierella simiarum]MBU5439065.1 NAD-dependent protein deacylase [Tissierella simiarum]